MSAEAVRHADLIGAPVWVDGFGRWHAAIPEDRNDGTGLILDARWCILDELVLRAQTNSEPPEVTAARLRSYVVEHVARRLTEGTELIGYVEFVEYDINGDTDPHLGEGEERPDPAISVPDYADDVAQRVLDAHAIRPAFVRTGEEIAELLAEAAREGYALGFGAAR